MDLVRLSQTRFSARNVEWGGGGVQKGSASSPPGKKIGVSNLTCSA